MVNVKARPVVDYVVRLVAGVAAIVGALAIVSSLSRGDLFGVALGAVLLAGGAFVLKRPGRTHRTG